MGAFLNDLCRFSTARHALANSMDLPSGVCLHPLDRRTDSRGNLTEIFRNEWSLGDPPVQWNVVHSHANVLRGVHAHIIHTDYLTIASGELLLGLHDLRPDAATHGLTAMIRLQAADPHLAVIPVGVAHGFYIHEPTCLVYGVSSAFDGSDEFGCMWNAPGLKLAWPCTDPLLSERDQTAGDYDTLQAVITDHLTT